MGLRKKWNDSRMVVGTMESQSDLKHEPTIASRSIRVWEKTVLRCDCLFSNSESVQRSLEREYGIKSQVIPTGVDTKFFSPPGDRPPNRRPRVLFVGSLRPFKQPQFLLDAAARFPQADFRIAGDGPLASELKSRTMRERLANVTLLGSLGADNLREEYRSADVFLFPSSWEGSPKVILEAAACGLPAIVRNNYSPETVVHGVTGYQAASDNELYAFLAALLANPGLRHEMGRKGRQHSQKFDWDLITAQWDAAFMRLVHRQSFSEAP